MPALPTGTVTLLFTDIEGSTRLLRKFGDDYAAVLAEHRRVLRQAFQEHRGVEMGTEGDAFFVAFASAADAVAAAAAAQRSLADGPVRVRMGVHTGSPLVTSEGYVGEDVHLAARVAAAGHGGQVLLTRSTRDAVGGELRDLGEHRVKDFAEPVWIFQLGEASFPPLKTIANTNLPRPGSRFIGRERESAEIVALFQDGARLITLTGPGGSGKTRLAIEAASELLADFHHGVFWVGLATLRDSSSVPSTIAQSLGAHEELVAHIGDKDILLLLDNLEQVIEAAPVLAELVESCPNLRLLATSREVLRVRGEIEYEVVPLADRDAVELFSLRSALDPDAAIEQLCRRLDNMPLAIELAAARTRALTPPQILERLGQRLDLFSGGRDADPRQATLRAAIEWSHDLLDPSEQQLFARLAVFAGGCTLEAAETVAGAELDTIQSLVEKSLLRRTDMRFWMLETILGYAAERLEASDEADELRRTHAHYFLEIAESANLSIRSLGRGPQRHELVLPEQDNLRAAIDWATESDVELGLRLVTALETFWTTHDPQEGIGRMGALLERSDGTDQSFLAEVWRDYGGLNDVAGHNDVAEAAYIRSGELFRLAGDERGEAEANFRLGVLATIRGNVAEGRTRFEDSLETWRRLGDRIGELQALGNLGNLDLEEGQDARGLAQVNRSLELAREIGWSWWVAAQLGALAEHALRAGQFAEAEPHAREIVEMGRTIEDRNQTLCGLAMLAWAAAGLGDETRAIRLWATVDAEEAGPGRFWQFDREAYRAHMRGPRAPGPPMPLDEAVEYALGGG